MDDQPKRKLIGVTRSVFLMFQLILMGMVGQTKAQVCGGDADRRIQTQPLAQSSAFDRQAWLDDFAQLKRELERRHAHLAWFASPQSGIDLPKLDRTAQRDLERAESDDQAKAALLAFVDGFHDGHLRLIPGLKALPDHAKPLPGPDLSRMDARTACAALGYAPVSRISFTLPFDAIPGFDLDADGVERVFRAGTIQTPKGIKLGIVRVPRFRPQDVPPSLCETAWSRLNDKHALIDKTTLAEAAEALWMETLALQLERFRHENAAAVIVDIGGNGGGNDSGDWLPRLFSKHAVHSAPLLVADAPESAAYFDEQLSELNDALKSKATLSESARNVVHETIAAYAARKEGLSRSTCDLSWVWREQRPWNPIACNRLVDAGFSSGRFDYMPPDTYRNADVQKTLYWPAVVDAYRGAWSGAVYVLIDNATGSSAEMFAAEMRDNDIAMVVGERSMGAGCGFMANTPRLVLNHSGLQFQIPNCVRLRADGSDDVAGIVPNIDLTPLQGEDARARAYRLLGAIDAQVATVAVQSNQ